VEKIWKLRDTRGPPAVLAEHSAHRGAKRSDKQDAMLINVTRYTGADGRRVAGAETTSIADQP